MTTCGAPADEGAPMVAVEERNLLPGIFVAADGASQAGERRYLRASAARLVLTIGAATSSALFFVDEEVAFGLAAAAAFLAALIVELWMLARPAEHAWYEGRAIAESAKTIAWRYAVGGDPFPISDPDAGLRLGSALDDLDRAAVVDLGDSGGRTHVTEAMRALRQGPLATRRATYLEGRVADQRDWYLRKATATSRRASQLKVAMLAGEALGVGFALSEALGLMQLALSGVAATAISAGAAWLTVRQHESTARTYTLASQQLRAMAERLALVADEAAWATEVGHAEEAITREHAAWHAARTARTLPGGVDG